jgi:glycosyltransferase involved in cell wall biosynthesis
MTERRAGGPSARQSRLSWRRIEESRRLRPVLGVNGIRLLGKRTGVGRAIEAFLAGIGKMEHPFDEIRIYTPEPIDGSIRLPERGRNVVLRSRLPWGIWEQFTLPAVHGRLGPLFCPSYVAPLFARCPVVLTHHGSYEGYPPAFPWRERTRARLLNTLSARSADIISTVSAHSRRDIERFYGIPRARVAVIPEGVDTALFRPTSDAGATAAWRRRIGSEVPYILYVGKPAKRRNLDALIAAFAVLRNERGWRRKLVLLGANLPGSRFEAAIREHGVEGEVVAIDHVAHEEVRYAYACAEMMVYPSSYEGFGMPVLEAMACGTPVIALDNTAFPEFAGGVAWLLKDARPETLAEGMHRLANDEREKARMRREGPLRSATYDWSNIVPLYLDLLRQSAGFAPVAGPEAWARFDPEFRDETCA